MRGAATTWRPACHDSQSPASRRLGLGGGAALALWRAGAALRQKQRVDDEHNDPRRRSVVRRSALYRAPGPALAEDAPRTVTDYYDAMQASAAHLDDEVTERQKAGDMAAAQRIALAAAWCVGPPRSFAAPSRNI